MQGQEYHQRKVHAKCIKDANVPDNASNQGKCQNNHAIVTMLIVPVRKGLPKRIMVLAKIKLSSLALSQWKFVTAISFMYALSTTQYDTQHDIAATLEVECTRLAQKHFLGVFGKTSGYT